MLPYGKQTIEADDIAAVLAALQSDWLTTGPTVGELEIEFARQTGTRCGVALSSGTAALHTALVGAGIADFAAQAKRNNDPTPEVIVPAITFVATANAAVYIGAQPVFADIDPETLLIDVADVARKITPRTKAIVAMDYAGQPCDYASLRALADRYGLQLIADACHSLGGRYFDRPVGSLADFTCFSLHPIKQITAGEGGMVVTDDEIAANRMKTFRNHGITTDHRQREQLAKHQYAMETLGFNYRLTDIQSALALSQLEKLERFTERRNEIAAVYRELLSESQFARPLRTHANVRHARHLFVVRWDREQTGISRDEAFDRLRSRGIGVNVHYQPVFQHPFYRSLTPGLDHACPQAELVYREILSLPIYPTLSEGDIQRVVRELRSIAAVSERELCVSEPERGVSDEAATVTVAAPVERAA